jgi:hypothetical protein
MTKEIKTEIVINSSKERIWEVLTNFKEYPVWNPFIQSITGKIEIGEKLKVKIVPPNSKGMIFNPTVLALEKGTKLCWLGNFLFKGLFDGTHQFELIDNGDGSTTFLHNEVFKGFLLLFLGKNFELNTKYGFILMNENLKKKLENND